MRARRDPTRPSLLGGGPPALPPALDGLQERWVASSPRTRLLLGTLAALVLLAVAGRGAAVSPWGPATTVVVATRDLPAGATIEAGDLTLTSWPARLAPDRRPAAPDGVVGHQLAIGLTAGMPLTTGHVAEGGIADGLVDGSVAFRLPLDAPVPVQPGRHVDLVSGDGARGGQRLASGARVLAVEADAVWLALARDEAPVVAGAVSWGPVHLAVLPPR